MIVKSDAVPAFYLRLSMADGDLGKDNKDESNSIENQRLLLQSYVDANDELIGEVIEYVDDGYSGTNFNRPAFKKMIEDAKKGKIHTIIVKDLSRLGRDYIGVGDYLEQIFPVLGIRFIALNSNYDSNKYIGKTMGLDMAVSNLVNNFYSRDLSKKLKAALRTKWKQGKCTSGRPPYGYVKDESARGGWKIDPEAAKVVKLIFDKANEGWSTRMITEHLNEQGIVPPGIYREQNQQYGGNRKIAEKECLWDIGKVRVILYRYEYTGAFVHNYREKLQVGSSITRAVPESERYISEDKHDAIITHEEYENAQAVIRNTSKPQYKMENQYALRGKIRCGKCRLVMSYIEQAYGASFYCAHKSKVGSHSNCCSDFISVDRIDASVWRLLRNQLQVLQDLGIRIKENQNNDSGNKQQDFREMEHDIEVLQAERIRQYEAYAEGMISKEQYVDRKSELTEKIETLKQNLEHVRAVVNDNLAVSDGIAKLNDKAEEALICDKLTREIAEAFIETVYIYDSKTIEVQFKFDDLLQRAMEKYA
jgi:DNA invertase Pin-like site-specific DNA recombinase